MISCCYEVGVFDEQTSGAHDTEADFDAVVLATGFRTQLDEWLTLDEAAFDHRGLPKGPICEGLLAGLYISWVTTTMHPVVAWVLLLAMRQR